MKNNVFEYTVPWDTITCKNIEEEVKNQVSRISLSDAKEITLMLKCTPEIFKMEIHKNINLTKTNNFKDVVVEEIDLKNPEMFKKKFSETICKVIKKKNSVKLDILQNLNESINKNYINKVNMNNSITSDNSLITKNQEKSNMDNQESFNINKQDVDDSKKVQNNNNEKIDKKNKFEIFPKDNTESIDVGTAKEIGSKARFMINRKIGIIKNTSSHIGESTDVNTAKEIDKSIPYEGESLDVETAREISIDGQSKVEKNIENVLSIKSTESKNVNITKEIIPEVLKNVPHKEGFINDQTEVEIKKQAGEKKDEVSNFVAKIEKKNLFPKIKEYEQSNDIPKTVILKNESTDDNIGQEIKPIETKEDKKSSKPLLQEGKALSEVIEINKEKKEEQNLKLTPDQIKLHTDISKVNNEEQIFKSNFQKETTAPFSSLNKKNEEQFENVSSHSVSKIQPLINIVKTKKDELLESVLKEEIKIPTEVSNKEIADIQPKTYHTEKYEYLKESDQKEVNEKIKFAKKNDEEQTKNTLGLTIEKVKMPKQFSEVIKDKEHHKLTAQTDDKTHLEISKKKIDNQLEGDLKVDIKNVEILAESQQNRTFSDLSKLETVEKKAEKQLDNFSNLSFEEGKITNEIIQSNKKEEPPKPHVQEKVQAVINDDDMEKEENKKITNSTKQETKTLFDDSDVKKNATQMKNIEHNSKQTMNEEVKISVENSDKKLNVHLLETPKAISLNVNKEKDKNDFTFINQEKVKDTKIKSSDISFKKTIEKAKKSPVEMKSFFNKNKIRISQINPLMSDTIDDTIESSIGESSKNLPTDLLIQSCTDGSPTSDSIQSIDNTKILKFTKKNHKMKKEHFCKDKKKLADLTFPLLIGITSIVIIATIIIFKRN